MRKLQLLSLIAAICISSSAFADGWGSISGQFVLEGDVPEVAPLVKKGDATAKDAAVCAAQDIPNEAMEFNPKNKGIANIVVFMRRASKVHPDLASSEETKVEFDQKNCQFLPHAMVVRTDQTIVCKSSDQVSHNVNIAPFANSPQNFIIQPGDQKGVDVKMPLGESLPVQVKCDIHPWMKAWWVVLDHPYAAVTDEDGKFTIENLPEGENEFRVWHEAAGYINRKWVVTVKDGEVTDMKAVEVPLSMFEE